MILYVWKILRLRQRISIHNITILSKSKPKLTAGLTVMKSSKGVWMMLAANMKKRFLRPTSLKKKYAVYMRLLMNFRIWNCVYAISKNLLPVFPDATTDLSRKTKLSTEFVRISTLRLKILKLLKTA